MRLTRSCQTLGAGRQLLEDVEEGGGHGKEAGYSSHSPLACSLGHAATSPDSLV